MPRRDARRAVAVAAFGQAAASFEMALEGMRGQPWDNINKVALSVRAEARAGSEADRKVMRTQVEKFLDKKKVQEDETALRGGIKVLGYLELDDTEATLLKFLSSKQLPLVRVEAATALRFALSSGASKKALRALMELRWKTPTRWWRARPVTRSPCSSSGRALGRAGRAVRQQGRRRRALGCRRLGELRRERQALHQDAAARRAPGRSHARGGCREGAHRLAGWRRPHRRCPGRCRRRGRRSGAGRGVEPRCRRSFQACEDVARRGRQAAGQDVRGGESAEARGRQRRLPGVGRAAARRRRWAKILRGPRPSPRCSGSRR